MYFFVRMLTGDKSYAIALDAPAEYGPASETGPREVYKRMVQQIKRARAGSPDLGRGPAPLPGRSALAMALPEPVHPHRFRHGRPPRGDPVVDLLRLLRAAY
jgi:hypothetical protein